MSRIKIVPTMFLVYDYDREEDYINSMSEKGWQLIKGGLIHHTYRKSDVSYRYKLDFNNNVYFNSEEFIRYKAIFSEQGWEHINSTFNGWHYFRKKYDPALAEEEYEIYTDDTSLKEMLNRWVKIARMFEIIFTIFFLLYLVEFVTTHRFNSLIVALMEVVAISLFEVSIRNMDKKKAFTRSSQTFSRFGGYLLLVTMLFILIFMLFFSH